jgi:hypothetical protein
MWSRNFAELSGRQKMFISEETEEHIGKRKKG